LKILSGPGAETASFVTLYRLGRGLAEILNSHKRALCFSIRPNQTAETTDFVLASRGQSLKVTLVKKSFGGFERFIQSLERLVRPGL